MGRFKNSDIVFYLLLGFPPEKQTGKHWPAYIGCFREVTFKSNNQVLPPDVWLERGVEEGCVNLCQHNDPCQHQGRCVNYYTHAQCDCLHTNYEGRTCNIPGMKPKYGIVDLFAHQTLLLNIP